MKKITLFLLIAVMAAVMVVPVSAGMIDEEVLFYRCKGTNKDFVSAFCNHYDIPSDAVLTEIDAKYLSSYINSELGLRFITNGKFCIFCDSVFVTPSDYYSLFVPVDGWSYNGASVMDISWYPGVEGSFEYILTHTYYVPESLSEITESYGSRVFDEIISLLPVILVCVVSFISIRKGIDFLMGFLRKS